ncbi:hypothetical protein WBP06_12450 [Novosphingobium sp. BL-8H]|uniref:hypothetical protein n=1 Tax=Novosphingobium sp. BL-8H TaxID=3127640 RepID=UPI0037574A67
MKKRNKPCHGNFIAGKQLQAVHAVPHPATWRRGAMRGISAPVWFAFVQKALERTA